MTINPGSPGTRLRLGMAVGSLMLWLSIGNGLAAMPASGKLQLYVASTAAETGIMDFMVAGFRELHPEAEVAVTSAGALEVLDRARNGHADLVITHHPKSEQLFINEGYAISRTLIMYDEFVILGPRRDPLGLAREKNVRVVMQRVAREQVPFLVPGLRSATALALGELWSLAGIKPDWPGFEITGASSAATLRTADLFESYTFSDVGTFLANRKELAGNIIPLYRDDVALRNYYSALVVSQKRFPQAQQPLAETFVDYLVSEAGQNRLAHFGEQRFGTQVFLPAAYLDEGLKARRARAKLEKQSRNLLWMTGLSSGLAVLLLALTVMLHRLHRMGKVLQTSEERFRLAVAGTRDGIWDWDLASNRAYVSPRFNEIMKPPSGVETIVDPIAAWTQRMDPADRERFMSLLQAYLDTSGDRQFTTEYRLGGDTKDSVWIVMRGKALRDATGKVVRMSGSISDVSDRKQQETEMKRLEYRAMHDVLTGLPNRVYFIDQAQQALKAAELGQTCVALIFMDLDGFKEINDTLGHQTGDLVLQQTAQRLRQVLRVSDTIARFGGDEFAVLLPGSNRVNACAIAQKILNAFGMPFVLGTRNLNLGISLGISLYPDHGKEITTLVECADTAMYSAKRTKNGFVVYPTA